MSTRGVCLVLGCVCSRGGVCLGGVSAPGGCVCSWGGVFWNVLNWLSGALQMHKILSCCLIEGNNASWARIVSPGMKTISHNLKTLMFKLKPSLAWRFLFTHWCLIYLEICSRGCLLQVGCLLLGGCLLPGVCSEGGVCFGGCLLWGWYPSMHWGRHPLPPCGQTDACKNITFATSLRTVKIAIYPCFRFKCKVMIDFLSRWRIIDYWLLQLRLQKQMPKLFNSGKYCCD